MYQPTPQLLFYLLDQQNLNTYLIFFAIYLTINSISADDALTKYKKIIIGYSAKSKFVI